MLLFLIDGLSICALPNAPFLSSHYLCTLKNVLPIVTAPNWVSLLTGLPPSKHGVRNNKPIRNFHISTLLDDFDHVLVVSDWRLFKSYFKHVPFVYTKSPLKWLATHDTSDYDLIVVNVQTLDHIGHEYGWESRHYCLALKRLDSQIRVLVKNHQPWFLTADHGGRKRQHDSPSDPCIRLVPLCGKLLFLNKLPTRTTHMRKFIQRAHNFDRLL